MSDSVNAGSVYSEVRIKLTKLRQDLNAAETELNKFSKTNETDAAKTEKAWGSSFGGIKLSGVAAAAALTLAFKSAVSVFAQTEQSLANVQAVTNATGEEFTALESAAREAGATTRFTASEAADALFYLASAGFDATQSVDALDGVLLGAGATGSDLAFTAQTITAALAQFDLAASEATDVSNVFAAANSNSQATMQKLSASLRQAGPIAGSLGISLEETVGALQLLYNAGFQGEQAGTALRNALSYLASESGSVVGKLEELGIAFEDVNPEVVGIEGAIRTLGDAGLSTADIIGAFGNEVGPQMVTLINQGGDAIKEYTTAVTDTQEAARQYGVQNDTLAGSQDRLKSATEAAEIALIDGLAPALQGLNDLLATVLNVFSKIPAGIRSLISGFAAMAVGTYALSTAMGVLGVTIGAALGPITLVAGAVGAVVAVTSTLVKKSKEQREQKLAEQYQDIADSAEVAAENLEEFLEAADMVEGALIRGSFDGFTVAAEQTKALSENLGISLEAVVDIGLKSEDVTDQYKEQLQALKDQLETEKGIKAEQDFMADEITRAKRARVEAAKKAAAAEIDAIEDTLTEKQKANIEQRNIAEALHDYELELIADRLKIGLIDEEEARDQKVTAEEDLIEKLLVIGYNGDEERGKVGTDLLRKALAERLVLLEQFVDDAGEATSRASDAAYQRVIDGAEKAYPYQTKTDREWLAEFKANRKKQEDATTDAWDAIVNAGKDAYDETKSQAELEEKDIDDKQQYYEGYYESLERMARDQIMTDREYMEELNDLRDENAEKEKERQQAEREENAETANYILDIATSLYSSLNDYRQADYDNQMDAIDARVAAEIAAAGITEETEIESLERRIKENEEAGDTETANELQDELDRTIIIEQGERDKAQIQYQADLSAHNNKVFSAIANSIAAGIRAFADFPFPVALGFTAVEAGLLLPQLAALNKAKPQPPSFQYGGIVTGSGGADGATVQVAENGSTEMMFNDSEQGRGMVQAFARELVPLLNRNMSAVLQIGENEAASGILRIVQDGSNTGRVKINPRAVR